MATQQKKKKELDLDALTGFNDKTARFADRKEVSNYIESLIAYYKAINHLGDKLMRNGPGAFLEFTFERGDTVAYAAAELSASRHDFISAIKKLGVLIRNAGKRSTGKRDPATLKGSYTPIYVGQAFIQFMSDPARFGMVSEDVKDDKGKKTGEQREVPLLDSMPWAKAGYVTRYTAASIIFNFHDNNSNGGNRFVVDDYVMAAFGTDILPVKVAIPQLDSEGNVLRTEGRSAKSPRAGGKRVGVKTVVKSKELTADARQDPYFANHPFPRNTFEAIRLTDEDFLPEGQNSYELFKNQKVISLNAYEEKTIRQLAEAGDTDMLEVAENLANEEVRGKIVEEILLLKGYRDELRKAKEAQKKAAKSA